MRTNWPAEFLPVSTYPYDESDYTKRSILPGYMTALEYCYLVAGCIYFAISPPFTDSADLN